MNNSINSDDRDWLRVKDVIQKLRDREWYYKQPVSHYRKAILEAYDELAAENASIRTAIDQLREENDRLRRSVCVLVEDFVNVREENAKLRAAIDRVRALHRSGLKGAVCDGCAYYYPCPTLRALDGEDA
jgi:dynactin complex subunit